MSLLLFRVLRGEIAIHVTNAKDMLTVFDKLVDLANGKKFIDELMEYKNNWYMDYKQDTCICLDSIGHVVYGSSKDCRDLGKDIINYKDCKEDLF